MAKYVKSICAIPNPTNEGPMKESLEKYKHQLIVLGNGFDLVQGLKTGYADYFKDKYGDNPSMELMDNAWDMVLFDRKLHDHSEWANVEQAIREQVTGYASIARVRKGLDNPNVLDTSNLLGFFIARRMASMIDEIQTVGFLQSPINHKDAVYLSFMRRELTLFEHSLYTYLKKIVSQSENDDPWQYTVSSDNLYESIAGMPAFGDKNVLEKQHNTILTFNYTSPFQRRDEGYFPGLDSVRFVHGSLAQGDIIIGIDALNQGAQGQRELIDDEDVIPFTKTFRTLQSTSDYDAFSDVFDDETPDCIKFFGHSLSEADYSYFQSIFDHVDLYEGTTALMFLYRPDGRYDGSDLYLKVTKLINKYGDTLDNKDHGKNLLHKLILENRLSIKRVY